MVNGRSSLDALAEPVADDFDNSQFIRRQIALISPAAFPISSRDFLRFQQFTIDDLTFHLPALDVSDQRHSSHSGNLFLARIISPSCTAIDRRISVDVDDAMALYSQHLDQQDDRSACRNLSHGVMACMLRCDVVEQSNLEKHT